MCAFSRAFEVTSRTFLRAIARRRARRALRVSEARRVPGFAAGDRYLQLLPRYNRLSLRHAIEIKALAPD